MSAGQCAAERDAPPRSATSATLVCKCAAGKLIEERLERIALAVPVAKIRPLPLTLMGR